MFTQKEEHVNGVLCFRDDHLHFVMLFIYLLELCMRTRNTERIPQTKKREYRA